MRSWMSGSRYRDTYVWRSDRCDLWHAVLSLAKTVVDRIITGKVEVLRETQTAGIVAKRVEGSWKTGVDSKAILTWSTRVHPRRLLAS
jgi:hypothetical protein